jgi:hypothetical protein
MQNSHARARTFVVQVWVEEPAANGRPGLWRGHVTDVLDGKRVHVQDLDQVIAFMARYLRDMGVEPQASGADQGGGR